ncbi:major facilitator superfamily transporter [Rhizoctonia solani]|uniref:Major facilitator superfamily transporter n=1 Tax=Rhizoctonia solani TaxID=456999 RepID=A0A8H8NYM1_9AGAM|nr:major facilitator superfamily transporter [Rhizoctonia solani]QRW20736.1 major facilitator superfamily transporter [Rhizoctonia solani]
MPEDSRSTFNGQFQIGKNGEFAVHPVVGRRTAPTTTPQESLIVRYVQSSNPSQESVVGEKQEVIEIEHSPVVHDEAAPSTSRPRKSTGGHGDAALAILGASDTPVEISPEQDAAVLRKVDRWLVPVMLMVYFLQQLDKSSLSYTSVFGIVSDTNLVGSQYSWLGSIVYVAQLIWQPVSSYFLVKLPVGKYLFFNVFMWGVIVASTAAAHNFSGLIATRFFWEYLRLPSVAPCFITITQMWWRRREQTMRLSLWMAMNGVTSMFGSLIAFGIGHIHGSLKPYQTIFLFIGLLTLVCSPVVYFVLPDSPSTAKFLSQEEKVIALERLRANNQGTESKSWEWGQFVCALPSGGISTFGPLIINGFGFSQFHTILLNSPFGAFQWPVLFFLTLPPIAGASALYVLGREPELRNELLGCYYVLSFFTGIQPMLYSWASQNTAGHTKKTCTTGLIYVAQCAGNIVGPLLYKTTDAPYYHRGLIAKQVASEPAPDYLLIYDPHLSSLICWIILAVLTPVTALYLAFLNKQHASARRRAGKKAEVIDTSLEDSKHARQAAKENEKSDGDESEGTKRRLNDQAFNDLTDLQNEDFIYVL